MSVVDLARRAAALVPAAGGCRVVVGISGAPGAGKTTLARLVVEQLDADGVRAAHVPMDGFHLADVELDRLGRRARKGAIDTFDVDGYAALLARVRAGRDRTVWAPGFERTLEQPVAGSIPVLPEAEIVITEGNYLLSPEPAWRAARAHLDETWHCRLPADVRRDRLVARHVQYGKSPDDAAAWVARVDEPNATLIETWSGAADLEVDMLTLATSR